MKTELYGQWKDAVRRTTNGIHERFPDVPREDIEQECWRWVYSQTDFGPALRRKLYYNVARWAWKEVQEMDPDKRSPRLYTAREMAVFLKVVLQPRMRAKATSNWDPWLNEIEDAMSLLEEDEEMILVMRYEKNWSLRQIAEAYGYSVATADRNVWRAISRLQDILEGEPPPEGEWADTYVGTGGTISNAQARAEIGRNE